MEVYQFLEGLSEILYNELEYSLEDEGLKDAQNGTYSFMDMMEGALQSMGGYWSQNINNVKDED